MLEFSEMIQRTKADKSESESYYTGSPEPGISWFSWGSSSVTRLESAFDLRHSHDIFARRISGWRGMWSTVVLMPQLELEACVHFNRVQCSTLRASDCLAAPTRVLSIFLAIMHHIQTNSLDFRWIVTSSSSLNVSSWTSVWRVMK